MAAGTKRQASSKIRARHPVLDHEESLRSAREIQPVHFTCINENCDIPPPCSSFIPFNVKIWHHAWTRSSREKQFCATACTAYSSIPYISRLPLVPRHMHRSQRRNSSTHAILPKTREWSTAHALPLSSARLFISVIAGSSENLGNVSAQFDMSRRPPHIEGHSPIEWHQSRNRMRASASP